MKRCRHKWEKYGTYVGKDALAFIDYCIKCRKLKAIIFNPDTEKVVKKYKVPKHMLDNAFYGF